MKRLSEYRYVLLVAAAGLALMLWPSGRDRAAQAEGAGEEARLAAVLSQIEGVGRTEVLLSDSGAVVVCEGADASSVRLAVVRAVRCYTGLGANEVEIFRSDE